MRTEDYKRYKGYIKAKRKQAILRRWGIEKPLGRLIKGKIHCSCDMCQTKTRKTEIYSTNHRNGKNWKIADLKKPQFYQEEQE